MVFITENKQILNNLVAEDSFTTEGLLAFQKIVNFGARHDDSWIKNHQLLSRIRLFFCSKNVHVFAL